MKTNSIFDSNRFGRLMAYDMRLNGTAYLLKLAAFTVLMYLWMLIQMRNATGEFMWHPYGSQQIGTPQGYLSSFFVGLILLGGGIGTSFTALGNKVKRTSYLQLPASAMEKYLQPILIRIVLGTGLFFLLFWMDAQLARLTFDQLPIGNLPKFINGVLWKPDVFSYSMLLHKSDPWVSIIMVFVSLGTFLFACPLFFRKLQLLKTVLVFFTSLFLIVCLLVILSHIFYPGEVHGFDVEFRGFLITKKISNLDVAIDALVYLSWLFFLVIGYFRLKESKL